MAITTLSLYISGIKACLTYNCKVLIVTRTVLAISLCNNINVYTCIYIVKRTLLRIKRQRQALFGAFTVNYSLKTNK